MRPAVVIPVYNHGPQVASVIINALKLDLPVFVVNDGSTDNTGHIIDNFQGMRILHHDKNLGKGAALLTGFQAAWKENCDYGITIDGDGQHDPEDAKALLKTAKKEQNKCLVIGKRLGMEGANVPWTSQFGRQFSNFWVWVSGGPLVEDSQSGFRLYPIPEVMGLEVQSRRYQFEVEVLVQARLHNIPILETPVRVVYQPKGVRVSHFRPWQDFWRNSSVFTRLIFARIFRIFRS